MNTTPQLRARALILDVAQAYTALLELCAFAPVQVAAVLDRIEQPAGHGENHVDNAGHVVSAIVPGECATCHGHATADGTWIPAGAA